MWVIGSKNEYGLINISEDKQITWKFPVKGYDNGISFSSARCIYPLSAHTLLIGTTSNGLYRYDTLNHELIQYATHQKDNIRDLSRQIRDSNRRRSRCG